MNDYENNENVLRVKQHLTETKFNELFPERDAFYTYNSFIKAVAKYPAFCNEKNGAVESTNTATLDETCKRELSALFAHITYASGNPEDQVGTTGLKHKEDPDCKDNDDFGCQKAVGSTKYPAVGGEFYYGRGPLMIESNSEYGAFGDAHGPISYDGKQRFLEDPDSVLDNDYLAYSSALYFYMTPSMAKPSMHDVMTNYWVPNGSDTAEAGFGATIAIIGGGAECSTWNDSAEAKLRMKFYTKFLSDFGLDENEDGKSCKRNYQADSWPAGGAHGSHKHYLV